MLFTVIDIESNGLIGKVNPVEVLEVGYMQVNEHFDIIRHGVLYFYQSSFNIENEAQAVHGLTREFLEQYEDEFDDNLVRLYTLLERGFLVTKNGDKFDIPVLQRFIARHAPHLASFDPADPKPIHVGASLDMQTFYTPKYRAWYEKTYGEKTRGHGKLGQLMDVIGYTQEDITAEFHLTVGDTDRDQAHAALYDVFMTYLLLKAAVETYGLDLAKAVRTTDWERAFQELPETMKSLISNPVDLQNELGRIFTILDKHYKLRETGIIQYNPGPFEKVASLLKTDGWLADRLNDTPMQSLQIKDSNGLVAIIVPLFGFWCISAYQATRHEAFIQLAQLLYHALGLIDITVEPKATISLDMSNYGSKFNMLAKYLQFRETEYGKVPTINLNSMEVVELCRKSELAFWQAAFPTADILIRDCLRGWIELTDESLFGLMMFLSLRGGV